MVTVSVWWYLLGFQYAHYHLTDPQIIGTKQEKNMTLSGEWNPSIMDNPPCTVQRLKQLPTTPIDATDDFYNIESEILLYTGVRGNSNRWMGMYPQMMCFFKIATKPSVMVFDDESISI